MTRIVGSCYPRGLCEVVTLSLLRLDVLLDDVVGGRLLAPVADDDGRAADHLAGLALGVQLAQAGPLAELLVGVDLVNKTLR